MDGVFGVLGERREVVRMDGRGFGIEGEKKKSGGKLGKPGSRMEWMERVQCRKDAVRPRQALALPY